MATSWAERPFLVLDTETTGVDPATDRIVEIAAVTIDPDGTAHDPWTTIVDPGVAIPDEAAAIHGITTERARAEGISPLTALAVLADRLYALDIETTPVVMYNARFDWPLVLAEAGRHRVDVPTFCPVLDPYLIDRMGDKYRRGSRKLVDVADQYGVTLTGEAHGALVDAIATGQIMRAIAAKYEPLRRWDLPRLWRQQVRWHEQWRESYLEHCAATGEEVPDIPPGWPVPLHTAPDTTGPKESTPA